MTQPTPAALAALKEATHAAATVFEDLANTDRRPLTDVEMEAFEALIHAASDLAEPE